MTVLNSFLDKWTNTFVKHCMLTYTGIFLILTVVHNLCNMWWLKVLRLGSYSHNSDGWTCLQALVTNLLQDNPFIKFCDCRYSIDDILTCDRRERCRCYLHIYIYISLICMCIYIYLTAYLNHRFLNNLDLYLCTKDIVTEKNKPVQFPSFFSPLEWQSFPRDLWYP